MIVRYLEINSVWHMEATQPKREGSSCKDFVEAGGAALLLPYVPPRTWGYHSTTPFVQSVRSISVYQLPSLYP